jgi:hypothetical protein
MLYMVSFGSTVYSKYAAGVVGVAVVVGCAVGVAVGTGAGTFTGEMSAAEGMTSFIPSISFEGSEIAFRRMRAS